MKVCSLENLVQDQDLGDDVPDSNLVLWNKWKTCTRSWSFKKHEFYRYNKQNFLYGNHENPLVILKDHTQNPQKKTFFGVDF